MVRRSRFNNTKIKCEDGEFDSKKEYNRWWELKLLQKSGKVSGLQRQVKFELIPKQRRADGKAERSASYIADFVYIQDGKEVVEDAKGAKTPEYILKRKLMLYLKGITVIET